MSNPKVVVLACGKGQCCPEAIFHDDGSLDLVDRDDGKNDRVHLNPVQARLLRDTLNKQSA